MVGETWAEEAVADRGACDPLIAAADEDAEPEGTAAYLIAGTKQGLVCCLHLAHGCHYARGRKFRSYQTFDSSSPPAEGYNAVCRLCWPRDRAAPQVPGVAAPSGASPPEEIVIGTSSESSGSESSTSSGSAA